MRASDEVNAVAYRDVLLNTILGLVLSFAMLIQLSKIADAEATAGAEPPGNLIVHISWPEGDTDVDLWVDGPGEPVPVGYSNKGGLLWNLLRDDLGNGPDATTLNYENAYTRGIVPGVHTINVHCYRCPVLPVPVDVEVSVNPSAGQKGEKKPSKILLTTQVELKSVGQERTAVSFRLDNDGNLVPDSLNSVFKPLRSSRK